jgi:hypothetical protein
MDPLNPPDTLFRFFDKEEHARDFVAGKIRFRPLTYYKNVEGTRRDETEGEVRITLNTHPNHIHYEGCSISTRFILCTASPEADQSVLKNRFGPYVVRISAPRVLKERIDLVWRKHHWASDGCALAPVVYNKGELSEAPSAPSPDYAYRQKERSFEMEMEFRYVLTCSDDRRRSLDNSLTLTLGDCSDICSL